MVPFAISLVARASRTSWATLGLYSIIRGQVVFLSFLLASQSRRGDLYNILWAIVFGFATLNILSLAARRFEPNRRGLSFGELMAVLVVLLSVFLLGWEMLNLFHIFPIKLKR